MYVKKIEIAKYRHIKDVCLGPFTAPMGPSEIIVLAGPNGGGKSSILELISLTLSQAWSLTYNLNRTQPESSFEIQLGLLPKEIDLVTSYTATNDTQKEALEQLKTGQYYCRGFQYLDGEYEKNKALKALMSYVDIHPHEMHGDSGDKLPYFSRLQLGIHNKKYI